MDAKLVLEGTEGIDGRALMLISALHLRAERFADVEIVVLGRDPVVLAAAALLRAETGLRITSEPDLAEALQGARLFAAVAFRDTAHLPFDFLRFAGVPALVAIQFPDLSRDGPAGLALQRAAHDPALLAEAIAARIWPR